MPNKALYKGQEAGLEQVSAPGESAHWAFIWPMASVWQGKRAVGNVSRNGIISQLFRGPEATKESKGAKPSISEKSHRVHRGLRARE